MYQKKDDFVDYFSQLKSYFGSIRKLARELDVDATTIYKWRYRKQMPISRAKRITEISDGKVVASKVILFINKNDSSE